MHFTDPRGSARTTTGVIGALGLDHDEVLPHERTLPKTKSDRLELLRATRANLDPIWALSLAPGLSALLAAAATESGSGDPTATAVDADGVRHELWAVRDPGQLAAIGAAVTAAGMVLADGHHRFETACVYRDERPADDTGAGRIMALVVELAPEQLLVRAIHRLLLGLAPGVARATVEGLFEIRDAGRNDPEGVDRLVTAMEDDGALGLVDAGGLALLVPRPSLDAHLATLPAPLRDVDSARADAALDALPRDALAYRDDARTVAAMVGRGDASAAVLLRPVAVDAIRTAAAAGVRMPEKTTFFAPKPRTGMVFRGLDD
jgi:uncharacterized protein (DUF1015 family)